MVQMASHIILNKQVALKVVTLHKIKDPYVSKNLKREPAIMATLNQPSIVSVGDFYCLVLGGNVCRHIIESHKGFKLQEEIASCLLKRLAYLPSKTIVYCSIKLENILQWSRWFLNCNDSANHLVQTCDCILPQRNLWTNVGEI